MKTILPIKYCFLDCLSIKREFPLMKSFRFDSSESGGLQRGRLYEFTKDLTFELSILFPKMFLKTCLILRLGAVFHIVKRKIIVF